MKKSTRTWIALGGAAAAAWWFFGRKSESKLPAPYVPAPTTGPKPVCSGPFRYGWNSSDYDAWFCWDFCDKKRVDDAVCELG